MYWTELFLQRQRFDSLDVIPDVIFCINFPRWVWGKREKPKSEKSCVYNATLDKTASSLEFTVTWNPIFSERTKKIIDHFCADVSGITQSPWQQMSHLNKISWGTRHCCSACVADWNDDVMSLEPEWNGAEKLQVKTWVSPRASTQNLL